MHNTVHHILLYADDILLYLGNAPQSVPYLLQIFKDFGSLSGYKINWSKSALLPLNEAICNSKEISGIPFVKQFRYLGIPIHSSVNMITKNNFNSIFRAVESDCGSI